MAHSKKTRKVGLIGVRKQNDNGHKKSRATQTPRVKKSTGRPAGSRNQQDAQAKAKQGTKQPSDPRHGSKRPISLIAKPEQKKYATPAQELAALEADQRLQDLLVRLDEGHKLSTEQQVYVDEHMARHQQLCELMGIDLDDADDDEDDDPMAALDAYKLDDFK